MTYTNRITHPSRSGRASVARRALMAAGFAVFALGLTGPGAAVADDAPTIRFGTPTWPGVTVKSEIATQLLEHMGYQTSNVNGSPSVILNSLKTDDLDIYLGGWMPTEKEMIDPLVEQGEVKTLTTNISNAIMGIAVPKYVWDAGVKSEADLAAHADKFDSKIYGIEAGTGFNKSIKEAIEADRHGLGEWELVPSSTSAMLAQVGRMVKRDQWIVFLGWEPHWMNIAYDIKYLTAKGDPKIAETKSDVLTVANVEMVDDHPMVAKFFTQYQVEKDEQSKWVYEYSYKDRKKEEVASEWIRNNMDRVGEFLKGVEARDGEPAIEAVKSAVAEG
jgi:glycine betaine/proline transport system substrate-binding protein